jgi:large subunit ribosomal protein L22
MSEAKKTQVSIKDSVSNASARMVKTSIKKLVPFARLIRGMSYREAALQAQFGETKVSQVFLRLINAAAASAENDMNVDSDSLFISKVVLGKDKTLRRFMARGRGRSSGIKKRYSKITVIMGSRS